VPRRHFASKEPLFLSDDIEVNHGASFGFCERSVHQRIGHREGDVDYSVRELNGATRSDGEFEQQFQQQLQSGSDSWLPISNRRTDAAIAIVMREFQETDSKDC
jgi:hypothetical protein